MPELPKRLVNLPKHFRAYAVAKGRKKMLLILLLFLLIFVFLGIIYVFIIAPRSNFLNGNLGLINLTRNNNCRIDNIADFNIKLDKKWFLVGEEFLQDNKLKFSASVNKKSNTECDLAGIQLNYAINNNSQLTSSLGEPSTYSYEYDLSKEKIGDYQLTVTISDGTNSISKNQKYYISNPVYVAWTIDWEGRNLSDESLNQIMALTNRNQKVPLTHFFNPRYYTTNSVANSRADQLIKWIKNRQTSHDDMIGLHTHMYYDLVEAAGVKPKINPNWANRGTGSDVPLSAYSLDEQRKIIKFSIEILEKHGLSDLRAFRAGGWFANADTMTVLDELGFAIESSGRDAYTLGKSIYGPWQLSISQQPYLMCKNDINKKCTGNDAFRVLQMPNNGGESYRLSGQQLVDNFKKNYTGGVSKKHVTVNFLSHPEAFYIDRPKITQLFNHIDKFSFAADKGPVVYANLDTIRKSWILNK